MQPVQVLGDSTVDHLAVSEDVLDDMKWIFHLAPYRRFLALNPSLPFLANTLRHPPDDARPAVDPVVDPRLV